MDFSKYNKGLRLYAALFNLNPDVFNTDKFVDIVVIDNSSIGIIYTVLYDQYIIKELTYNEFYYNKRFVKYKDTERYAYVFTLKSKEDILTFKSINTNGSLMLTNDFYIKVCIVWKKYLDVSFYECLNVNM